MRAAAGPAPRRQSWLVLGVAASAVLVVLALTNVSGSGWCGALAAVHAGSGAAKATQSSASAAGPGGGPFKEVFATLFAREMQLMLNLTNAGPLPPENAAHNLADIVRDVKAQGVSIFFASFKWWEQNEQPGAYDFRLMDYVQQTVCGQGMQLAVLLEGHYTPPWVTEQLPDAGQVDARGETREEISIAHERAMQHAYNWHEAALAQLASINASCIHSVQPTFNNEVETKYTQMNDSARDYSEAAVQLFRQYFRGVHGSIKHWNARWKSSFDSWAAVQPPKFGQHLGHFNSSVTDLFYWDFQHFRHRQIHTVHEGACMHIAAHGFRCILHFPEFMTGADAIYASGAVFTLAASPWLDYVVVDSNFLTPTMKPNDVRVVTLLVAAMKPFGKPVFFEGAFERINDPKLHQQAVALTAASGAHGMGFTNWLDQINPEFFGKAIHARSASRTANAPAIAILSPYRSYRAYKGGAITEDGTMLEPVDYQQDRLFKCLDSLEAVVPSLDSLQIFGVPSMLLPVLHEFEQVWYAEPDVLLSGDAKLIDAIKQRASALGIAMHSCFARETPPIVLPECCPSL